MARQQRWFVHAAGLALLVGFTSLAHGKTRADCEREYTPQRGQEGKDVIWLPTEDAMVVRMLEMAKVTPADTVYDLGAGDGKIAIAAGKHFGATAVGIEYDAALAQHAQCLVEAEGVAERVKVVQGDIFEADFSAATVVTLYLLPDLNLRLRPVLLDMQPGTRVVSYSFTMGEWEPDDVADTDEGVAYLWVVPAKVGGTWAFRSESGEPSVEAVLEQTFQRLQGAVGGAVATGTVDGRSIDLAFTLGGEAARLAGFVDGDRFVGRLTRGGRSTRYLGTRAR